MTRWILAWAAALVVLAGGGVARAQTVILSPDQFAALDGLEALATTIAGDTTDIEAAIELLDNAAGITPSDNFANPTGALVVYALTGCWDGSAWDRCTGASADTELPSAATLADNTANPSLPAVAAYWMCYDGATWDRCVVGTDTTHDNTALLTGPQIMGYYRADLSGTAFVSNNESARILTDGMGRQLTGSRCPGGNLFDGQFSITDGSSTSVVAAGGASIVLEVWEINMHNTSASAVNVDIRDGTAGAVLDMFPLPPGAAISRPLTIPIRSTANTAIAADPSAAATTISGSLRGCTTR